MKEHCEIGQLTYKRRLDMSANGSIAVVRHGRAAVL